ncbi:hypothetical protein E3N88_12788 [Mikania micrantha]|uniref:Uncharacterized protein n=1 Tax=Mikania micrantha TaxID=192012 RepID=A0A5N6P7U3_9ASTR|nr:hypothetical protein E3N88_12788 [Mikania micrantha]
MVKAIRVYELAGPEVLKWEDVEIGDPLIYISVQEFTMCLKFLTHQMEAIGVVIAIREGCDLKIGDIVYHSGRAMGAYTEEHIDVMVDPCVADDGYI